MNYKLDTDTHVFFYEQEFYVLSNFSAFKVKWKDIVFDTVEAAYHWEKFHHYPDIQGAILKATSAHEALKIAESYKLFVREDWYSVKFDIMLSILREKANQHEYVARKLEETGGRILVEDSWRDTCWGWGADQNGENNLGKLWMKVREERRKEDTTKDNYLVKENDKKINKKKNLDRSPTFLVTKSILILVCGLSIFLCLSYLFCFFLPLTISFAFGLNISIICTTLLIAVEHNRKLRQTGKQYREQVRDQSRKEEEK